MNERIPCSIGKLTNTTCHKTTYIAQSGLLNGDKLSAIDKEIFCFRVGITDPESIKTVCLHHEYYYMVKFMEQQRSCCNPFQIHKKTENF